MDISKQMNCIVVLTLSNLRSEEAMKTHEAGGGGGPKMPPFEILKGALWDRISLKKKIGSFENKDYSMNFI